MPVPVTRIRPELVSGEGLDAVLAELEVPTSFPAEVEAEAEELEDRITDRDDRRDLPLVTIDPDGARDLDQALLVESDGAGGHIVWYAIADVAAFVTPGGAIDGESHARGVTLYPPHRRIPLHPPALSEDRGSLLAGQDRPAVLWRLVLDQHGELTTTDVSRALVRSRRRMSYRAAQAAIDAGDEALVLLRTVGRRREEREQARGGLSLPVPEQEVVADDGGYGLEFRATLPAERWNAQISLLCGMAAAQIMLDGGWGLLRTLPPATDEAMAVLRRQAGALGVAWADDETYGDVVHRLDTSRGADAAFAVQATRLFRGAGYLPIRPDETHADDEIIHAAIAAPYAHVTAPLRRLGDRYATEAVLAIHAGHEPPDWVVAALDELPRELQSASSRARALENAVYDHLEALLLSDDIGATFPAVVVDHRNGDSQVQVSDPAVVATVPGTHQLGDHVTVRVDAADPATRTLELSVV